jgi:HlyD family secretion protein
MDLIPSSLAGYTLESYLIKISSRSRIIYWIIIFIVTGILAVLPFIYVDVSVQTRGYFQSEIEKQKICAPFHGKVIYTNLKRGTSIKQGDTLLIIDSETIKAQREAILKQIRENELAIRDLDNLNIIEDTDKVLGHYDFRTERYFVEYTNMLKSRSIQNQSYQQIKAEYERNKILHEKKLIPDSEFEKSLFSFRTAEGNLNQVIIYQKTLWHADLMNRRDRTISLKADLKHYEEELNNRVLLSTVDGKVIQSAEIQKGTVIGLDQMIAEISPEGELVATCFVKPGDIGLINHDQQVRIMVDALHYNEWGFVDARITDISDDMIIDESSNAYFRVRCKPDRKYLSLKNGMNAELKKGMSLNARIVVTKRSLFNLLFDKADKWFNPYVKSKI